MVHLICYIFEANHLFWKGNHVVVCLLSEGSLGKGSGVQGIMRGPFMYYGICIAAVQYRANKDLGTRNDYE